MAMESLSERIEPHFDAPRETWTPDAGAQPVRYDDGRIEPHFGLPLNASATGRVRMRVAVAARPREDVSLWIESIGIVLLFAAIVVCVVALYVQSASRVHRQAAAAAVQSTAQAETAVVPPPSSPPR